MAKSRSSRLLCIAVVSIFCCIAMNAPAGMAADEVKAFDKYKEKAQASFAAGKYGKAESQWRHALSYAREIGDQAKIVEVMTELGKTLQKANKNPQSGEVLQEALELSNKHALDATAVKAQLAEIADVYRPIDLSKLGPDVKRILEQNGTKIVYAMRQPGEQVTRIRAYLEEPWTKSTENLYKQVRMALNSANGENGSGEKGNGAGEKGNGAGETENGSSEKGNGKSLPSSAEEPDNPVKQLKMDKEIEFDIVRDSKTKYRLAKIDGISAEVGLWVNISEIEFGVEDEKQAYAKVHAGKFGFTKSKTVKMPRIVYDLFIEGIDGLDPFVAQQ